MAKILPTIKKPVLAKSFVSISKAAKFLQVSPDTLRNWEKQGRLLPSRTHGGARRYSRVELLGLKKEVCPFVIRKKGLISISQAARALKVSPDTLRNWDKKGLINSQRSKGGTRRFTRDEIRRLQQELGIEIADFQTAVYQKAQALAQVHNSSQEIPNFLPYLLKVSFSALLILMFIIAGWFFVSSVDPLEKRTDETAKLVVGMVKSIEALQKGVLGIQTQAASMLTASSASQFSNVGIDSANDKSSAMAITVQAPLILNAGNGQITCASCLTLSSDYVSSFSRSDETLSVSTSGKHTTVSVNLGHANTWTSAQTFNQGGYFTAGLFASAKDAGHNFAAIFDSGNVGIGWTSPINKLEIAGAQTVGKGYAGVYTAPDNGLLVQGNVGIGVSAPSFNLDVSGGARFGCAETAWNNDPATNCSDVAEVYQSDGDIEVADVVAIGNRSNTVTKSTVAYQPGIVGVYSSSPGLLIGGQTILGGGSSLGDNKIPVALTGRVSVKVSDENGAIAVGDYLTSSSIPGVAMKATRVGPVLGQALEPFTAAAKPVLPNSQHLIDFKVKIGKILVFVKATYADPVNFLASLSLDDQGNLIVPKLKTGSIILDPFLVSAANQLTINNEQLTINSDPNPTAGSKLATGNYTDLSGQIASMEERIKSQAVRIARLEIKINNAGNVGIGTSNLLSTSSAEFVPSRSANQSATASAQIAGVQTTVLSANTPGGAEDGSLNDSQESVGSSEDSSATTSARLKTEATSSALQSSPPVYQDPDTIGTIDDRPASSVFGGASRGERLTTDLHLTPPGVLLATSSAALANLSVTETLSSDKLFTAMDIKTSGNLSVFGNTILAATTIAGGLTVDGTLSVNGNSINVIGSPDCSEQQFTCGILYLQSSPLAYQINFFNGLTTLDKFGNLKAQIVTVSGFRVIANKISGSGKIISGTKFVNIDNAQVGQSSRILITPTSETNLVLAVTDKTEGKKFTVSVAQAAVKDINFDWFIINESTGD